MTYLEAAVAVLKAARTAMSIEETTEAAIRKGLIHLRGNAPVATVSTALFWRLQDAGSPALSEPSSSARRGRSLALSGGAVSGGVSEPVVVLHHDPDTRSRVGSACSVSCQT